MTALAASARRDDAWRSAVKKGGGRKGFGRMKIEGNHLTISGDLPLSVERQLQLVDKT